MANTNAPNGFTAVRRLDGAAWTGNQTERKINSTSTNAVFKGDLVKVLSTGYIDGLASADFTSGTAGVAFAIFQGCYFNASAFGYRRWSNFWPGSGNTSGTDIVCQVIDDPNVVLEVQCTGGPLTFADIGNTVNAVSSSGNAVSGISNQTVSGTGGTSATAMFRIVGLPAGVGPGLDAGSASNRVEVAWNNQLYKNVQTGV